MELIDEAELAVTVAEETARAEYEKALDPIASPDAAKAKRSIWAAEFNRDRLRAFLSRLWERLDEIETAEKAARWKADYAAIEAKRDALASEFAEMYPRLTAQLCDLFKRAKAIDEECARINGEALSGEHRRLLGVELTALNLGSFTRSNPSLMDAVKLPDWAEQRPNGLAAARNSDVSAGRGGHGAAARCSLYRQLGGCAREGRGPAGGGRSALG